ncbi:ATPase, V0 complex, subunit e1/e2 family-containing protein [Oopsacas minuta]|uniref:ATPase, V0 complex, subunit e1/e2 family-containing protein n=1 Tax=Oopsacas minuta TaxID=111878 RepID=A0AAV7KIN2_9METZ|nr:ATPase, V0 complex, subunit e1/e2 family-containing protein [Oopsacas minuta]
MELTTLILALPSVTAFWLIIGIVLPASLLVLRGKYHAGIIQTMLVCTAICCYLFWLIAFLVQLNPLVGPVLKKEELEHIARQWNDAEIHLKS